MPDCPEFCPLICLALSSCLFLHLSIPSCSLLCLTSFMLFFFFLIVYLLLFPYLIPSLFLLFISPTVSSIPIFIQAFPLSHFPFSSNLSLFLTLSYFPYLSKPFLLLTSHFLLTCPSSSLCLISHLHLPPSSFSPFLNSHFHFPFRSVKRDLNEMRQVLRATSSLRLRSFKRASIKFHGSHPCKDSLDSKLRKFTIHIHCK